VHGEMERQLIRTLSTHAAVPAFVRRMAARIESSPLAYRLAHGVFWSFAGTALARTLALAASVVTARLLGKQGYGEFGVVNSTLLTLQTFASVGLGATATRYVAELRAKDPERAARILALSAIVSAASGLLGMALLWAFSDSIAIHMLNAPPLAGLLRIAAVGLVFTTLNGAQVGALAGFEAFRTLTWLNMWSGLLGVPLAVAGVWFWGLQGAVWATVATGAVQWSLSHFAVRDEARAYGIALGAAGWWREQRVLWSFSLPALAQGIMVAPVNWAAAAILVNQPRGYPEMGVLSVANQWFGAVMFLPVALGGAVLPVLLERVGQGDARGARMVLGAAVAMNTAVVVPIVAGASLASPWIMEMYGKEFGAAWHTLVVVLITAGLVAATTPVGNLFAAAERLWLAVLMNSGWAILFLVATLFLVKWGALGVATARLIAYVIHVGWTLWFALSFLRAGKQSSPRGSGA